MTDTVLTQQSHPNNLPRSIGAFVAGAVVGIALTLGTDVGLHAIGVFPALGQPMASGLLLIATFYRTVYGVVSSYILARLAPNRPMGHALVGGLIGLVVNIVGTVVTWNRGLGPHWYPLALIALAMPAAWVGGKLRTTQLRGQPAD
ncbi:MAG TPA: hypothetical protein VFE61_06445 [Candidatus Sulfotelmatobacter sp.]|jgi:hypothetical protein|nr:hypothetical protein [Candidatus Sulfotelmatobacter sp.]